MPNWNTLTGSMGKTIGSLIIGIILLSPNTALSDGNELLSQCNTAIAILEGAKESSDPNDAAYLGYCFGLLGGVTGLNRYYQNLYGQIEYEGILLFCIPESGMGNGQAARIAVKYMREHPERLHENAVVILVTAFMEAFPCKK